MLQILGLRRGLGGWTASAKFADVKVWAMKVIPQMSYCPLNEHLLYNQSPSACPRALFMNTGYFAVMHQVVEQM